MGYWGYGPTRLSGKLGSTNYNWYEIESGEVIDVPVRDPQHFLLALRNRSNSGRFFWARYEVSESRDTVTVVCYPVPDEAKELGDHPGEQRRYVDDVHPELTNRLPALPGARTNKGGRPLKYPWPEWMNGELHVIDPADYDIDAFMLGVRARSTVARINSKLDPTDDLWWVQIEDIENGKVQLAFMRRSELADHPLQDRFTTWTRPVPTQAVELKLIRRSLGHSLSHLRRGDDEVNVDMVIDGSEAWREGDDVIVPLMGTPNIHDLKQVLKTEGVWVKESWSPIGGCVRIMGYYA